MFWSYNDEVYERNATSVIAKRDTMSDNKQYFYKYFYYFTFLKIIIAKQWYVNSLYRFHISLNLATTVIFNIKTVGLTTIWAQILCPTNAYYDFCYWRRNLDNINDS